MSTQVTPSQWWRHGVVYQIYPRSFMDGNGDGIGDLAGATARLPYLRDLGVDAVWFTPWYVSPQADGGYDVADYRRIDPRFGDLADAEKFIAKASEFGIRTIIDIVPNHVSDQHVWFQAALNSAPGSPERARFWFADGKGPNGDQMPTNWLSSFRGHTWTRTTDADGRPGQWYLHLFTREQPDLNWNNPEVRAEHEDILRFWFDRGVAGVRVDSAALIIKDPTLPDVPDTADTSLVSDAIVPDVTDPTEVASLADGDDTSVTPGQHPFIDRDGIHDVYRAWRRVAQSYDPPRILVGEVFEAARVDGAGPFALFARIVLPMSKPILGVVSVFAFIAAWKDFLWPMLVLKDPQVQPLSVRLPAIQGQTDLGVFLAALAISTIVPVVFFLVFQKFFLSGAGMGGAVKG